MRIIPLTLAALVFAACGQVANNDDAPNPTSALVPASAVIDESAYGFAFSPPSHDAEGWEAFFPVAADGASMITWAGDWRELDSDDGPAPVFAELAAQNGMDLMVVVGPFSDGRAIRPIEANTDDYVDRARRFAEAFQPRYLTLGVEVDAAAREDADEFEAFVDLFDQAADAVHVASPDTSVLVAFQYESMLGRRDGLFGGRVVDDTWDLVGRFPSADIIAFTTYPGLIFGDPAEIPDDYYDEIAERISRPVAFVEIGWHSDDIGAAEWDSDPTEQADALARILTLTASLDAEPYIWSFLWDPPARAPFDSMGLFDAGAEPESEAWSTWLEYWEG